jgi:polar amino acid transport system substrate-binding protein
MRHLLRLSVLFISIAILTLATVPAIAQDTTPLRVAIKPLTPFVNYDADGSYSGFSIDLWNAIAARNNWTFEYVALETVPEVLDAVRAGDSDVGIAGISITREREETLDFSQPMFNAGLQIMTQIGGESPGLDLILRFFSPGLLVVFIVLLVVITLVGHVVWLVERKNPDFPDDYLPGVGEGIWWAASALIGGSDKMPRSVIGRLGALIWIVTGIVLIAFLTADLSAQNTVAQLESSIRGMDDLPGKRIVTVANTTSADFLRERDLLYVTVDSIEAAYQMLENERADAIVFDAPVLRYYAHTEGRGRVTLAGGIFARQDYGIAVQQDSPLREPIDRALLALLEDGTYEDLMVRWFGSE